MRLLGDPHLGRVFLNDVPLHRRGERERMVREDFVRQLDPQGSDLHVCMGDLFDKQVVPYETILFATNAYQKAARENRNTLFVVLQGNHDVGRDLQQVTAFHVFQCLVMGSPNIVVANDRLALDGDLFLGWQPIGTAEEQLGDLTGVRRIFGHWDTDRRGDSRYLVPTPPGVEVFTGHIHKPEVFERNGVTVNVVGSMQPYAHGEEANDDIYVTLTNLDGHDVRNKCVRLVLQEGEDAPIVDCLQLKIIRQEVAADVVDLTLDDFDFNTRFSACLAGVPENIAAAVKEKWNT